MARAKKFGTFGGVFTPSILTILGVIMYLRLPWIVGQAGLIQALAIVVVAHIISIATGLSVSSIATDKKVRAGGTYFMISRSLGLPIGGTLGLALFVGLSFSVSLYLIGFADSFLRFWNLPTDIMTMRITGSIALVAVTGVTLISTALALRTQYYIMAAIALSLLSILLGRHEFAPDAAAIAAAPVVNAVPFIVLFGIFFPAVTGFEAGVSMSGDLEDPKKSIPIGSMAAIATGLLVYIGLTTFLARTVSADQLANNPRVLLDIALFPPLVIAGIWGATISSAFGSILGAPRILQATSTDGITPRWFGVGHGRENEPRRALILAFIIAEAGILIGSLDVIARVVSMFFITTYGFLNLAAAIESWVSPDFRPEFRVPRVVGLLGATACFVVMIQLDFVAMVGASVLLGSVYFFLTRRQLRLETGDAWDGVWQTTVRAALHRLDRHESHRRNWRPNIVQFSLPTDFTQSLVEFGQRLVGRRGMLTSFRFVAAKDSPLPSGSVERDGPARDPYGVFARDINSDDQFGEMRRIARYYGFAGIEPNTVLLGWTGASHDARAFAATLQAFADQDRNVLVLDYDPVLGWGRRARIDVWWRLTGSDVALSLALIRVLSTTDEWRDATIRFITVNERDSGFATAIVRAMNAVLDDQRLRAEVRVVNNATAGRSFVDIIRAESPDTDLTILGMADLRRTDPGHFVDEVSRIIDTLGSVLLVHASSFFNEPLVRLPASMPARETIAGSVPDPTPLSLLAPKAFSGPAARAAALEANLRPLVQSVFDEYVSRCFSTNRAVIREVGDLAAAGLADLGRPGIGQESLAAAHDDLTLRISTILKDWRGEGIELQSALIAGGVDALALVAAETAALLPDRMAIEPPPSALEPEPDEMLGLRFRKLWLRARSRLGRHPASYFIEGRALAGARFDHFAAAAIGQSLAAFVADAHTTCTDITRILSSATDAIDRIGKSVAGDGAAEDIVAFETEALRRSVLDTLRVHNDTERAAIDGALVLASEAAGAFAHDASDLEAGAAGRRLRRIQADATVAIRDARTAAATWPGAQRRLLGSALLHPSLDLLRRRVDDVAAGTRLRLDEELIGVLAARMRSIDRALELVSTPLDEAAARTLEELAGLPSEFLPEPLIEHTRVALSAAARDLPESLETATDASLEGLGEGRIEDPDELTLPVHRIIEYLAETEVIAPMVPELARAAMVAEECGAVGSEVCRFVVFHLRRTSDDAEIDSAADVRGIVRGARDRLAPEIERLDELRESLGRAVDRFFRRLVDQLEPYNVAHLSDRLQRFDRDRRGRQVIGGLSRLGRRIADSASSRAVDLMYKRSESVLVTGRLRRGAHAAGSLNEIRKLVDAVSPRPEVLDRLPDHYTQLFVGRVALAGDLRFGFDSELAESSYAIDAHRRGRAGGLLLLSERGQGRGSLARLIARERFGVGHFYRVDAPEQGSIDPAVFARRLGAATGLSGPPDRIIASLPPGSAVLISDLGLWWERSAHGLDVCDLIVDLITRFGSRVFFIVGANTHAFRLIRRLRPVEDQFLRVVECQPFNSRQLRDVILLRHQSTGLTFELRGRAEDALSDWRLARLFTAFFDYSEGNVGWALNAWLAHITDVSGDIVRIVTPRRPSRDAFDALSPQSAMVLVQFAIHDRLDADRLARVTRLDGTTLSREVRALEQAGLVVRDARGVMRIDRFIRPHLGRYLVERELL